MSHHLPEKSLSVSCYSGRFSGSSFISHTPPKGSLLKSHFLQLGVSPLVRVGRSEHLQYEPGAVDGEAPSEQWLIFVTLLV